MKITIRQIVFRVSIYSRVVPRQNSVCMGIFKTALRDKKICQILTKDTVENLEIDKSPKWVPFNVVSGQITSNAPWK